MWAIIAGAATILAVIRPAFQLSNNIERYSRFRATYSDIYLSLKSLVADIQVTHEITDEMYKRYERILFRIRATAPEDDPEPNKKLLTRLQNEVNNEIPPESLWYPPD